MTQPKGFFVCLFVFSKFLNFTLTSDNDQILIDRVSEERKKKIYGTVHEISLIHVIAYAQSVTYIYIYVTGAV